MTKYIWHIFDNKCLRMYFHTIFLGDVVKKIDICKCEININEKQTESIKRGQSDI